MAFTCCITIQKNILEIDNIKKPGWNLLGSLWFEHRKLFFFSYR